MRKIRELMRLKHELGRSHPRDRHVARHCQQHGERLRAAGRPLAGLSWPLPEGLDDAALERPPGVPGPAGVAGRIPGVEPDWQYVHRELQRHKGVTLRLLWLESTGQSKRTETSTAGSATATGSGGGTSTWSRRQSLDRAGEKAFVALRLSPKFPVRGVRRTAEHQGNGCRRFSHVVAAVVLAARTETTRGRLAVGAAGATGGWLPTTAKSLSRSPNAITGRTSPVKAAYAGTRMTFRSTSSK